jgi:SAM-dependent methyltransferase
MSDPQSCPICGGALRRTGVAARDRLVTGDGPFGVLECPRCQYGITVPQLTNEELGPYYAESYYEDFYEHSERRRPTLPERIRGALAKRGAERRNSRPPLVLQGVEPGTMLEVGCGSGELLAHFASQGWSTYGIDPSEAAVAAAARRGAEVHAGTLDDHPWEGKRFDAIVFQHSLEHIPQPVETLARARDLLAPGGRIIIDVPNWASWQRRVFGDRWFPLDLPRHLQHFSPRALEKISDKLGMRTLAVGTNSNAIATAYSVHYIIAGRWTPGWKLWASYAIGLPLLPLVWLGDRLGGGDACYAVMTKPV